MNEIWLNKTKKKLTVIFTLLVFLIAVLLEGSFFSIKYLNYINEEENKFSILTNDVQTRFVSINEFIVYYDVWNRLFKFQRWTHLNNSDNENWDYVNLLIVNKEKNELVFSNIVDDLKLSFVEDILKNWEYWEIEQKSWYFIKKIKLIEQDVVYDVLFIKNLRYWFLDYLRDLLWFVWIMFLFSVLFFYIWYRFVSKNLEPVEKSLTDMQDFIHNAWHELKTPISIIHSNLQLIKETKTFDKELVDEWMNEINKLNRLIESLVELSSISTNEKNEKIDVGTEIESILKDFKIESDKKDLKINYSIHAKKYLTVNKQYFYILFSNLLWNAIKYTNQWWQIDVNLYINKLVIKDNWIWVIKDDHKKIFDRFYMWEKSRNIDWHGIWLSLVKKIADIYKWRITLISEVWKGSEFSIFFK